MEHVATQNQESEPNDWIACDGCTEWFHCKCVDMSMEVFNFFNRDGRAYICNRCSGDVSDLFNAKNFLQEIGRKLKKK